MPSFEFYLLNLSFEYRLGVLPAQLGERVEQFALDCAKIREHDEAIFRHASIYDTPFWEEALLWEVLYSGSYEILTRDQINALQAIVDRCPETNYSNDDILALLDWGDPEFIRGLLCLHGVEGIDVKHLLYSFNDWFQFHRSYFVEYPPSRTDFCLVLAPYFPNLFLNPDTIPAGLRGLHTDHRHIMQTIIHHLSALNDVYHPYFLKNSALGGDGACDHLENCFRSHTVQIGASRDRNDHQRELTFYFRDPASYETRNLYCDLHTKFYGYFEDETPSFEAKGNRIYFYQPIAGFLSQRVLVARIGKHVG